MDIQTPGIEPYTVSILVTPYTSASTLYGLFDVLSAVGISWEKFVSGHAGDPVFDVCIVGADLEPVLCPRNIKVTPQFSVEEKKKSDIAIVASFVKPPFSPPKHYDQRELDWLLFQYESGATVAAACTGASMMAESGILNGWEATTAPVFYDLFRDFYPDVQLSLERDLCVSGPDGRLVTSGGKTSWQDMALYLVTRFCGREQASNVAKYFRIPPLAESQAVYPTMPNRFSNDDGLINECLTWIKDYYSITYPVKEMVQQSGLSQATFTRRFKKSTGFRPMDFVHNLRVDKAKEMLETSDQTVENIGRDVGYEDPASFRRIFRRTVGFTPSNYRQIFSHSRFSCYELAK